MDDLGSKLKKLFKPKPKGVFKGKANVLGGPVTVWHLLQYLVTARARSRSSETVFLFVQATEQLQRPVKVPPNEDRPNHPRPHPTVQASRSPTSFPLDTDGNTRDTQRAPPAQHSGSDQACPCVTQLSVPLNRSFRVSSTAPPFSKTVAPCILPPAQVYTSPLQLPVPNQSLLWMPRSGCSCKRRLQSCCLPKRC